jgi:lipopolysaccharide export LptBFGC system permease protein LptF
VAAWGIATWGSLLGSLSLLVRRRLAVKIFLISTIGMMLTTLYNYVLSDGLKVMGSAAGALAFSAVIWVIAFLLWFYARAMCRRGVLR